MRRPELNSSEWPQFEGRAPAQSPIRNGVGRSVCSGQTGHNAAPRHSDVDGQQQALVLAGDFGDPIGEFAEGRSGGKAKRNRRIREDHAQPRFACLPIMMRLHVALHCSAVVDQTDGKRGVPARTGSETTLGRAQSTDRPSDVERRMSHFNSNLARLR